MKIVLLLAHSGEKKLEKCKEHIEMVLEELDVKVDAVDLHTLPYYKNDELSPVAALIAEKIEQSKGVIALTSAHIGGVHSSMQSFFEHFTRYEDTLKDKPLLVIASTTFQGERQAAYQVLQAWSTLGGIDVGAAYMNQYSNMDQVLENIERQLESYYRIIKQERANIRCSEYYVYKGLSEKIDIPNKDAITKDITTKEVETNTYLLSEDKKLMDEPPLHIDLSTKEQNIQELTQLLKQQIGYEGKREFIEIPTSTYKKPLGRVSDTTSKGNLKISNLPHYFIAQHDKEFQAIIQYILTDTKEKGTIRIKEGDCIYEEELIGTPTVEIILSQEVLEQILKKQLTYQKAFMIGKLKVKGNFGILAKLDQIFKGF